MEIEIMNKSIHNRKIMNSSDNFGIFFYFISALAQSPKKNIICKERR